MDSHRAFDISDQIALITGGGSGIGAATCRVLAGAGATVVAADVDLDRTRSTVEDITAEGGTAEAVELDVTDRERVDAVVAGVVERHGRLDTMCNIAGIGHVEQVVDVDPADLERVFDVNLKGVFWGCQAAIRAMRPNGSGNIVNVASLIIDMPFPGYAVYGMTKAAVAMLTRVLAAEAGPLGIRVNAISPGSTETAFLDNHRYDDQGNEDPERYEQHIDAMRSFSPLGLMGEPEDQAHLIHYLVSPAARFTSGANFRANGAVARVW